MDREHKAVAPGASHTSSRQERRQRRRPGAGRTLGGGNYSQQRLLWQAAFLFKEFGVRYERKKQREQQALHEAASSIQATFRGHRTRKVLAIEEMKQEKQFLASKLQALYRGKKVREVLQPVVHERVSQAREHMAAIRLQNMARNYSARAMLQRIRSERDSVSQWMRAAVLSQGVNPTVAYAARAFQDSYSVGTRAAQVQAKTLKRATIDLLTRVRPEQLVALFEDSGMVSEVVAALAGCVCNVFSLPKASLRSARKFFMAKNSLMVLAAMTPNRIPVKANQTIRGLFSFAKLIEEAHKTSDPALKYLIRWVAAIAGLLHLRIMRVEDEAARSANERKTGQAAISKPRRIVKGESKRGNVARTRKPRSGKAGKDGQGSGAAAAAGSKGKAGPRQAEGVGSGEAKGGGQSDAKSGEEGEGDEPGITFHTSNGQEIHAHGGPHHTARRSKPTGFELQVSPSDVEQAVVTRRKVRVSAVTYNLNGKPFPAGQYASLVPAKGYHVYVFGFQNMPPDAATGAQIVTAPWVQGIQTVLGEQYIALHATRFDTVCLVVFVHKALRRRALHEDDRSGVSVTVDAEDGTAVTACATCIRLWLPHTTFSFVCCDVQGTDLSAKVRNAQLNRLDKALSAHILPRTQPQASWSRPRKKGRRRSNYASEEADIVVLLGTLGFPLQERLDVVGERIASSDYATLYQADSLQQSINTRSITCLANLMEMRPDFAPTYRFKPNDDEYVTEDGSVPSWADRILFSPGVTPEYYSMVRALRVSEHRCVAAGFTCNLAAASIEEPAAPGSSVCTIQ